MKKSLLLFSAVTFLTLGTSYAQAPAKFNYQGIVRDANGSALANQAVRLRISIVENTATGTVVYQETQATTTNGYGLYNLAVGNGTPVTGTLGNVNWASGPKFIHVEIDATGGTNYADLGTTQLLSVPYALNAPAPTVTLNGNALSIGGNTVTLPAPPPPTLTLSGNTLSAGGNSVTLPAASAPTLTLTGNSLSAGGNSVALPAPTLTLSGNSLSAGGNSVTLPAATPPTLTLTGNVLSAGGNSVTLPSGGGSGTISGTANYIPKFTSTTAIGNSAILETSTGKVGIGTTTPAAAKVEIATTDTMALRITGNSASGARGGLLRVAYTGTSTTATTIGVSSVVIPSTTSAAGIGVLGEGGFTGVYGAGQAGITTGTVIGVRGEGYSDANAYGVYGVTDSYGSTPAGVKYGVVGLGDGGTTNIGVYGGTFTGATGTNYAGYFNGDVEVIGAISKSSGTFKIDHPQDPENKYLYHSFVESPDMMNVYNGNITTDANGYATVTLPGYFESLNKDFRYQLTVVGGTFAQAIVSEKVKGNTFQIRTNVPATEVSWQVTGIRNDAYAKAHRVQPEVAKEAENKGKYLNPVELGKSADLQIGRIEVAAPVQKMKSK